MISLYNIWTVARIEMKTLLRSWFFRIFSIIAVVFLGFWSFATLSDVTHAPWVLRGISSTIPYLMILFLNSVQAVIAVFLASDFLKRDKKLDTTEVVYMRSMTNGDYVAGKTLGILVVFLFLNVTVLLVSLIMQVILSDVPVIWISYLTYPLIISLPTLVFILGLAFLFMVTIRNQAVTFIVILGYIATTLFYLADKFHHLFDYMAYHVPLIYSGFTGFSDLKHLMIHRGIYLLLGLSFISFTVLMIRRLPQSRFMTNLSRIFAFASIAAAIALGAVYIGDIRSGADLRGRMVDLGNALIEEPLPTPLRCSIELEHSGSSINASAGLRVINNGDRPLEKYIFSLNPGLEVEKVAGAGGDLGFSQNLHVLTINPAIPLPPGETDTFTVRYGGSIDEEACYPDIEQETREMSARMNRAEMMNLGKRYAFTESDYLLLTPEALWYPVAGPGYSSDRPEIHKKDFIDFKLGVKTRDGLVAVSQGSPSNPAPGSFSFEPEVLLPSVTLAIGDYEYRSVSVDSVEYGIYYRKNHDFFSSHFSEIGDTLSTIIRDLSNDVENRLGLEYPYERFILVEVPIHFYSYRHLWSVAQETVQPQLTLLPEKGLPLRSADFRRWQQRTERRQERTNETTTAREDQCGLLNNFVSSVLIENSGFFSFRDQENPFAFTASYNVFPNFLTFTNQIESDKWPVLNMALEAYYAGKLEESTSGFVRFFIGMSPEERINISLEEKTLREILAERKDRDLTHYAIKTKGDYLFLLLESLLGEKEFNGFLSDIIEENRFAPITGSDLVGELDERFGFDFEPHIETWYSSKKLPGFLIGNLDSYKVLDGDRERYQVKFRVSNPEDAFGLLKITMKRREGPGHGGPFGGRRFGGPRARDEDELVRNVLVGPGEDLDLGFVLDYQPGAVEINTLISKNIPSLINQSFSDFELESRAAPFDGRRTAGEPVAPGEPGEIIVDNEDPGFVPEQKEARSLLKRLFPGRQPDEDVKYHGMIFWRNIPRWLPTTDSKFYGRYVRSAHFTNKGRGDRKASWTTELAESGYYDVYCHISRISPPWHRRDHEQTYGSHNFLIHHDDGIEDTDIDLNTADDGWNFLGSYYISRGTAKIEITNKSDKGNFVTADAVKWVKR